MTLGFALKRFIDIGISAVALLCLSPLFLVLAIFVKLDSTGPVFFRQKRPGRDGRPFTILKYRTMNNQCDDNGVPLPDANRITRIGKLMRHTSLDELPELWNVLVGEMSLVGPRPLMIKYLDRYTPEQARRHEVPPGITGLAQVNGRNAISWEQKFEYDIWYIDHWSLGLDFKILAKTVIAVLARKGISEDGHATASEFTGGGHE